MRIPPRRIERALVAIFDGEQDNAFTIEDLCERIWPDVYQDPQASLWIEEGMHRRPPLFERRATLLVSDRKSNGSAARDLAGGSCSSGTTR